MNAGCHGSETWNIVERVQIIERSGNTMERNADGYRIGYRSVVRVAGLITRVMESGLLVPGLDCLRETATFLNRKLSNY